MSLVPPGIQRRRTHLHASHLISLCHGVESIGLCVAVVASFNDAHFQPLPPLLLRGRGVPEATPRVHPRYIVHRKPRPARTRPLALAAEFSPFMDMFHRTRPGICLRTYEGWLVAVIFEVEN